MCTFFIGDLHFGHSHVIGFDYRPWETVDEMDEGLMKRWNRKVTPQDHVYVLGDFAFKNSRPIHEYTRRLNGTIHLIRGNHDKRNEQYESCFEEVTDYKDMVLAEDGYKVRLILCHYFMPFYIGSRRGAFMLHGHTHMTLDSTYEERFKEELRDAGIRCEAYNVGACWQDYEPQTFMEIVSRQGRKIEVY